MFQQIQNHRIFVQYLIRAFRLPFVTVSILPFLFGSLLNRGNFMMVNFVLGLITVVSTHLSANLINDYADSKSGADWQDTNYYKFFGGSKLIQARIFSESFYFKTAIICSLLAGLSIFLLALRLKSIFIVGAFSTVFVLAWLYSHGPFKFSHHKLGEVIIFMLFGPVVVMGGYFIQSGIFPTQEGLILSLPFGILTVAILFANEIPDFFEDKKIGKLTWVNFLGPGKSYLIYYFLVFLAFFFLLYGIWLGYLSRISFLALIFLPLAIKAGGILHKNYADKTQLIRSSKLTILLHTFISIVLIADILL